MRKEEGSQGTHGGRKTEDEQMRPRTPTRKPLLEQDRGQSKGCRGLVHHDCQENDEAQASIRTGRPQRNTIGGSVDDQTRSSRKAVTTVRAGMSRLQDSSISHGRRVPSQSRSKIVEGDVIRCSVVFGWSRKLGHLVNEIHQNEPADECDADPGVWRALLFFFFLVRRVVRGRGVFFPDMPQIRLRIRLPISIDDR